MPEISKLSIELEAKSDRFRSELQRAERRSRNYGDAAKKATGSTNALSTSLTQAANSASSFGGPVGKVTGMLRGMSGLVSGGALAWTGLGVAIGVVSSVMGSAAAAYSELERRQAKTEALLRATGHSAGFAGFELDSMARSVALATLASTDDIREAQDVLLTFRNVRGKVFKETISLSQDLAVVIGGTAKTAALQLGKALEDPVTGMTALTRSGVSFTQAEKDLVKELINANRTLEAQELILKKVRAQVGGAGEGEAGGLAGAADTLGQRWQETLEKIGRTSGVTDTAGRALSTLSDALLRFQYLIDPENTDGQAYFDELFRERQEIMDRMANAGNPDDLSSMPIPGVYDKNDWYDDQRRASALGEELKALRDANVARQQQAAKAREAAEATEKAADEERRAADEAERRTKALEEIAKLQQNPQGSKLWNEIMGISGPQRKTDGPIEKNYHFNQATRAANARIQDGDAVNAKHWMNIMQQSYEAAMRDSRHNYDVAGMEQIIKRLEAEASVAFGDLDKSAKEALETGAASFEVEGMGQSITMVADSALKLSESVNKMLGIDTSGTSVAEVTKDGKTRSWSGATAEDVTREYEKRREEAERQSRKDQPDMGVLTIKVVNEGGEESTTINGERTGLENLTRILQRAAHATPGA